MTETASFAYDPYVASFQDDPYAVYAVLREQHPVYHNTERGFWALSRFDDVWNAVHDTTTFSSSVEEANTLLPMMIYMDPPRHDALRALVSRAFTPKRIAAIERDVRAIARALLDAAGDAGFDVIADFAAPLPSTVIGQMIGVPAAQHADFRAWADSLVETDTDDAVAGEKLAVAAGNIYRCFGELRTARAAAGEDDLMSALVRADIDGERLTDEEVLGFCFLLVVAGNDTTTNLIANGVQLLHQHPEQRALLVEDPSRLANAVEEMLRYEPPAQALPRMTTREVVLHGTTIPAGERVLLLWAAANRDHREFPEPKRFDITRKTDRHLSFGHGAHFCLGAVLARLEARVAFEELLGRHPAYRVVGSPHRVTSHWARAFHTLSVVA